MFINHFLRITMGQLQLSSLRRRLLTAAAVAAFLFVIAEMVARYALGLGDPPLIVIDRDLEYAFLPGRSYERFGNHIAYNAWSMRSPEVPSAREPGDTRILVLGDSVVNGGALTDQRDLASEILARDLGPDAWVGNISAGSWGPKNLLAYTHRYGWFAADATIIVVSTHDLGDLPEYRPHYGPDFPEKPPISATIEGLTRYIPRHLPVLRPLLEAGPSAPGKVYTDDERKRQGEAAVLELLRWARSNVPTLVIVVHPTASEIGSPPPAQRKALKRAIAQTGVVAFDPSDNPAWNSTFYRDDIHLNARGQAAYAHIFECLLQALREHASVSTCSALSLATGAR